MALSKQKIKFLKSLLDSPDFYPFLCAYSDNNIDTTIDNLSKFINYVLTTDEDLSSKGREEILHKSLSFKKQGQYLIYATNSYLDNHIKLFGISPQMRFQQINKELNILDHQISYLDAERGSFFPLYGSIKNAIEEGFSHPKTLYRSILKQPSNDKRPVTIGESEATYYSSILQRRLNNVPNEYRKTGASVANKILKEIIGKDITLYFLPTDEELGDVELYEKVSPLKIRSINIPSRYSLLMICAKNRGLQRDTKISIDTGDLYIKEETKPKQYSSLSYFNYETVHIDENFRYENEELTGDINYDIDELYGRFAKEDTREKLDAMNLDDKLRKIKSSYDIDLTYQNGKYHISNGRHRILFLLHYYLNNYRDCKNETLLKMLKESTTILAYVERKIEDPELNKIMLYLERKYQNIKFLKTNILNNKFDVIVLFHNRAYHLRSKEDLIKFTNYLDKDTLLNEFYMGNNSNMEIIPYDIILARLVAIYKEEILRMDLLDLIIHLKQQPLEINGITIDGNNLNYSALYLAYTLMIHNAELDKYHKEPFSVVATSEQKLAEYERNKTMR